MPYRSLGAGTDALVRPWASRAGPGEGPAPSPSAPPGADRRRPRRPRGSVLSWRAVGISAVVTLAAMLAVIGPGSMQELRTVPMSGVDSLPDWTRPCVIDTPPVSAAGRLAFCARLRGRVVADLPAFTSGDRQRHVVVAGDFHVTLVELGPSMRTPRLGSTVAVAGPLQRGGAGLREMIALSLHG
jgi:hypothetical protein